MMDKTEGLAYLRGMIGKDDLAPMHRLMNFHLFSVGEGCCEISASPQDEHYNHQGRIHGGYLASLIDSALGVAVQTKLPMTVGFGTVQLNINYVRKLDKSVGEIRCKGLVLHSGRSMFTAEAKVEGLDDKLYAHGTGTFLVYPQ